MKSIDTLNIDSLNIPIYRSHTLIVGSGAAGLNTAVQLHAAGVEDLLIVSEGLDMGTSINTGSDKQTYYKLGLYGNDKDSPESLAESFFSGGGMHGEIALVEAALSARAFLNLVNLGVPFPRDQFGQFVGYKTDHDPLQRATSVGPYTSKNMCEVLIKEIKRREICVSESRQAVKLLSSGDGDDKRTVGALVMNSDAESIDDAFELYFAENLIFAVGGPGGIYKTSVYPEVHTGAIGLALMAGAKARGLPESQYGMASIKFRWNVSGTYMQVLPRFISTDADGVSDESEFLRPYFKTEGEMNSAIFLKGYQWPFDPRKVAGGSSIVDILVYIETVIKGRRVYMDFRRNSENLDFNELSDEAHDYLKNSEALFGLPIERLSKMNQPAIDLYSDHGIDITKEALEIAVCAQHNNGGLAGNLWWESENIKHLFPVGEVNGSHGVYRPGGSALNSGQVAGFRVAEYIANRYMDFTVNLDDFKDIAVNACKEMADYLAKSNTSKLNWREVRDEFQSRMSKAGAHIRSLKTLEEAVSAAWSQWRELIETGCSWDSVSDLNEVLRNSQLCFAHVVYLESVKAQVASGVGSRGSALTLDLNGIPAHDMLGEEWKFASENVEFREKVLETTANVDGSMVIEWATRHEPPVSDAWFENAWTAFRKGEIYQ